MSKLHSTIINIPVKMPTEITWSHTPCNPSQGQMIQLHDCPLSPERHLQGFIQHNRNSFPINYLRNLECYKRIATTTPNRSSFYAEVRATNSKWMISSAMKKYTKKNQAFFSED